MDKIGNAWWRATGLVRIRAFASSQLDKLRDEFEAAVPKRNSNAHERPFVKAASTVIPTFAAVLADGNIQHLVEGLLDRPANIVGGDATRYSGETYWHVDVRNLALPLAKVVIYLDPEHGQDLFSYMPCSQNFPEGSRAPEELKKIAEQAAQDDCPVHETVFRAGDAIVFNPRIAHAVFSPVSRRQVAVLFAAIPRNVEEIADLRQLLMMNAMVA